jgi:hypothetical protein
MNYAAEKVLGTFINIPNFIKIDSAIQNLTGNTHRDTQTAK